MRRGAALPILFVLALLLPGLPLHPLTAGASDGPTCGVPVTPCQIGPGTHEGSLRGIVNERDHYAITPPEGPGVIRVEVSSGAFLEVILRDPDGTLRAHEDGSYSGEVEAAAVADPPGEWRLEVGYRALLASPVEDTYTLILAYEPYDHTMNTVVDADLIRTFEVHLDAGTESRVDFVHRSAGEDDGSRVLIRRLLLMDEGRGLSSTFHGTWGGLAPQPEVKAWSSAADGTHVSLPESSVLAPTGAFGVDTHGRTGLAFGVADSWGLDELEVWIAWNGDTAPSPRVPGDDRAAFFTLGDFDGDGPGAFAGGYAHVEDVSLELDLPPPGTHTSVIEIGARTPFSGALEHTRMTVEVPDGSETQLTNDEMRITPWTYQSGTWRVTVDHLDGFESDTIRVHAAQFDMTWERLREPFE